MVNVVVNRNGRFGIWIKDDVVLKVKMLVMISGEIFILMVFVEVSMFCSFFCWLFGVLCDMIFWIVGIVIDLIVVIGISVSVMYLFLSNLMINRVIILVLKVKIIVFFLLRWVRIGCIRLFCRIVIERLKIVSEMLIMVGF